MRVHRYILLVSDHKPVLPLTGMPFTEYFYYLKLYNLHIVHELYMH